MMAGRLAALLIVGVLALTACGDDGGSEPEQLTLDEPTPTATPEPSTPADDGPIPEDPVDGEVTRGLSAAKGAEQRAVEEVWLAYWTELIEMYASGEVDRDAVYALADDAAATGPLEYAAELKADGHHQTGGVIAATSSIKISGDTATVIGCMRNTTIDVDADGEAVERPSAFLTTKDTLRREGPDWRVTEQLITDKDAPCAYR